MKTHVKILSSFLFIFTSWSQAQQITHTGSFDNNPGVYPYSGAISAPQFDPSLGTLTSVYFELASSSSAQVEGENNTDGPAQQTATLVGKMTASFAIPGIGLLEVVNELTQSVGPVSLGPTDEPMPDSADFAGPDYHDFGILADSAMNSITSTDPLLLPFFVGQGQVAGIYDDLQGWGVFSGGDAATRVTNSQSQSTWRVVYTYAPSSIPEASSSLLAMMAGGVALLRRKR